MSAVLDETDDEFLAVASTAVLQSDGAAALDQLGWWELLGALDDPASRQAVLALFRAQGRHLSSSSALSGIVAAPLLDAAGLAPGSAIAAIARRSARRGPVWALVGDGGGRPIVFAGSDGDARLVEPDAVELVPVEVPGHLTVHEVSVPAGAGETLAVPASARVQGIVLGRLAAAHEMLGAAERAVEIAVEYAGDREQFGQPIGAFQAVRHLLAWARTDCVAVEAVAGEAVARLADLPPRFDEVTKAIAGRNGRRACERSLQVLGGIGFTAEHVHHHHHSRVLVLDALLGSSSELTRSLGEWLRTTGEVPSYPAAVLQAPDPE